MPKKKSKSARRKARRKKAKAKGNGQVTRGIGRGLGELAGGYFGGPMGAAVGGLVGDGIGSLIAKITGSGQYTIKQNSLINSHQIPTFASDQETVRLRRTEFVNVCSTPGPNYNNVAYDISPDNGLLFPWLSGIANNFTEYRFNGLIFMNKSTSATAIGSTNTALGRVIMATNYDPSQLPYTTITEAENSFLATSCATDEDMIHAVECARSTEPLDILYVGEHGEDSRFDSLGTLQVITQGQQAASEVSELWVSYDITFSKPHLTPEKPVNPKYGHWSCVPVNSGAFAYDYTSKPGTSTYFSFSSDAKSIHLWKTGRYEISVSIQTTSALTALSYPIASTNTTSVPWYFNNASAVNSKIAGTQGVASIVVDVVATHGYQGYGVVTLPVGTFGGSVVGASMCVKELPHGLNTDRELTWQEAVRGLCEQKGVHVPSRKPIKVTYIESKEDKGGDGKHLHPCDPEGESKECSHEHADDSRFGNVDVDSLEEYQEAIRMLRTNKEASSRLGG